MGATSQNIQPKQAQLGDDKRGGRSRAGAERGGSGEAGAFPPTAAPSFFSRKRKQKGILCGGSVWGGLQAGHQRWEEGPRHHGPSCRSGAGGLRGAQRGLSKLGGPASLHGCSPCVSLPPGRSGGVCLLSRVAPGRGKRLAETFRSLPARGNAASWRFLVCFSLPVIFAAPSCGHSWKLIRVKIAVSRVWKPPEAGPGALQAGARGYETVSLHVGRSLPGEELSPASRHPWAFDPSPLWFLGLW